MQITTSLVYSSALTNRKGPRGHPCAGQGAGTLPSHLGRVWSSCFHPCPHCPHPATLAASPSAWTGLGIPHHLAEGTEQQIAYHQGVHLPCAGPFTHFFTFLPHCWEGGIRTPTLQMGRLRLRTKQPVRSHPAGKVSRSPETHYAGIPSLGL